MEDTLNCESTQVKEEHEPSLYKQEPISHCDDMANEFVDYTMVSVPITEIAEMEASSSFIDTIEQSSTHKALEKSQLEAAPEAMQVDESSDMQDIGATDSQDTSNSTAIETISKTCEVSAAPDPEVPTSSQTQNKVREDTNAKDDDVVMVLSDSDDEVKDKDETKTDKPTTTDAEKVETNKETMSEVAEVTLANDDDQTKLDNTNVVETENTDSSVIMLVDSPEDSEAEKAKNTEPEKSNSTETKGKFFSTSNAEN